MTVVPELFDTVDSRQVYDGKVVRLRVDEVAMPGGGTALREVAGHDRAVAVVAVDESEEFAPALVMVEQYRHPLGRRLWELPAGLMDLDGESALITAQRELAEETGLAATDWSVLVDVAASPGFTDEVVQIFCARGLYEIGRQGEITDEEADLRIVRVPLTVAVAGVFDGRIVNGPAVAGVLAAQVVLSGTVPANEIRGADDGFGPGSASGSVGDREAPSLPGLSD